MEPRKSKDQQYRVSELAMEVERRRLVIRWADGWESRFPFVWLRHERFYPALDRPDQRPGEGYRLPEDPVLARPRTWHCDDGHLEIDWEGEDHTSHRLDWLRDHCLSAAARARRKAPIEHWDAADAAQFPWFEAADLRDEAVLWALFAQLRDHGLVRLRGLSTAAGEVGRLAERFGPLRVTHFGQVFDIETRPRESGERANIGATSAGALGPHCDEGWRHGPPGITFFHCLKAAPGGGGDSLLVDGFKAAERLRCAAPEAFALLSRTPLNFTAERNPEERFRARARVLVVDSEGDLEGVRFTDRTLAPPDLPEDMIEPVYGALRALAAKISAPDLAYRHRLATGECHIFDNHRVLHARSAFDPEAGVRHLQQCSVDREEFHNRLRILARRLGRQRDAEMVLPGGALG